MYLRERERQLDDEVSMLRTVNAHHQRQIYQLIKNNEDLTAVNRDQKDEIQRLKAQLEQLPPPVESSVPPLPEKYGVSRQNQDSTLS